MAKKIKTREKQKASKPTSKKKVCKDIEVINFKVKNIIKKNTVNKAAQKVSRKSRDSKVLKPQNIGNQSKSSKLSDAECKPLTAKKEKTTKGNKNSVPSNRWTKNKVEATSARYIDSARCVDSILPSKAYDSRKNKKSQAVCLEVMAISRTCSISCDLC